MTISLAAPTDNTGAIRNNGSDVLTIDSSNNIGVGTSSPLTTLNISGGIGAASGTETTTQTNSLFALSATGTNTRLYQGIQSGSVVWLQAQNSDNSTKAISLNPAGGNVGIGTSSPTEGQLVNVVHSALEIGLECRGLMVRDSLHKLVTSYQECQL